ncbi:MAG TPA: uroporphyrinogen-III synthase [Acidimicrobiales bacterium]|nr:uroporphyrinogen-III synthase [Acidimicrobiales bacterium]
MTGPSGAGAPLDLRGRTVGITADRRGEEQALMFRRLGAEVVHGPTMATVAADPTGRLRPVSEQLIAEPPDVVVVTTGMGLRMWLGEADGWGVGDALRGAIAAAQVVCRGPKAAGAVRLAGLPVSWRAPSEQLPEVQEHLLAGGVAGARVAVQMLGDERLPLVDALRAAGATVVEVPVYRWTLPDDGEPARRLIEGCLTGRVDAVTFTAGPQVRGLVELADCDGTTGALLEALNGPVLVGCIGPVCAAVATEEGITGPLVPEHWRLGSLVRLVAEALAAR